MSRHVPRSDRWSSHGPNQHRSLDGPVVRLYKGEWWAVVAYRLPVDGQDGPVTWQAHTDRLGPFRRPRNAMVEAERHVVALRNRHGERFLLERPSDSFTQ